MIGPLLSSNETWGLPAVSHRMSEGSDCCFCTRGVPQGREERVHLVPYKSEAEFCTEFLLPPAANAEPGGLQ